MGNSKNTTFFTGGVSLKFQVAVQPQSGEVFIAPDTIPEIKKARANPDCAGLALATKMLKALTIYKHLVPTARC